MFSATCLPHELYKKKVIFLPPTCKDYPGTKMCWKFFLGIYSKHNIMDLWKANLQYTVRILKFQTEDNHLTKQAHYLLPTLEWESGLQRWRTRTLSLNSRTGKTISLSTLSAEFNPFSVPCFPKFNTQFGYTKCLKSFVFSWNNSILCHTCRHCHDLRQWIPSFYSVATATQVWMTQNQHYPDVWFPLHSFPRKFIQIWNSILSINTNTSTNFELFFLKGVYCLS